MKQREAVRKNVKNFLDDENKAFDVTKPNIWNCIKIDHNR